MDRKPFQRILSPDERRLSFGEHLEELRSVLIKSLLAVGVLAVGCLIIQDELMAFFRQPYDRMMVFAERRRQKREKDYVTSESLRGRLAEIRVRRQEILDSLDGGEALPPVMEDALRQVQQEVDALEAALLQVMEDRRKLHTIKPTTVFIAYIKVSLLTGIFLASPVILYQIWMFVGAGLLPDERRYVLTFLPISVVLFGAGIAFGYFVLVPIGLTFLTTYGGGTVAISFTLDHYLSLLVTLTLVLGVVFELPLIMIFFARVGIFTPRDYARFRRYSIVLAVVTAALLTPPDPVTQMLLAGPILALYEIGIWLSRALGRKPGEI